MTVMILLTGGATLLADAVQIDLQLTSTTGVGVAGVQNFLIDYTPDGVLTNPQSLAGYCVDPANIWYTPNVYSTFYLIPVPTTGDHADFYQAAVWIFNNYGLPTDNQLAADVQNAIWWIMDGNTTYAVNTQMQGIIDDALEAVAAPGTISTDGYMLAVSPYSTGSYGVEMQDFIVRTPEPASLLLLGLGLFGVGLVSRKKRS